jgi:exopolyphosphatase/guanosine-5'-triphosphate,3'-diphosphate pyrophosphatase
VEVGRWAGIVRENSEPQPIGVASIGSNDIHLLVATTDGATRFDRLLDRSAAVELVGAEVQAGGHPILPAAALAGALDVLDDLIARARSAGARDVVVVGTEALREAANGAAFCSLLAATFGIEALVITGEEEAGLDYAWATFPAPPVSSGPPEAPLLVVDSGGGSTQVIVSYGPAVAAVSLPIGAENLSQRFLAHDPPKARELAALSAHVSAMMDQLPLLDAAAPPAAILMGGSADHVLTFAAQPKQRHLTLGELDAALAVAQRKPASKLARDYKLPAKRGRLVAAGAAILRQVLGHYGVEAAQVKADGIRGGLIVRCARHGNAWRADLGLHGVSGTPRTPGVPDVRATTTRVGATAPRTRAQRRRPARD